MFSTNSLVNWGSRSEKGLNWGGDADTVARVNWGSAPQLRVNWGS